MKKIALLFLLFYAGSIGAQCPSNITFSTRLFSLTLNQSDVFLLW